MLNVNILRDGEPMSLEYKLGRRQPLVPVLHGVDCIPSYYVVGGLVFVPLSIPFLEHAYGGKILSHSPSCNLKYTVFIVVAVLSLLLLSS
jgi:hypothetical protein